MDILQLSTDALDALFGDTPVDPKENNVIKDKVVIPDSNSTGLSSIEELDIDNLETTPTTEKKSKEDSDEVVEVETEVPTDVNEPTEVNDVSPSVILKNTVQYLIDKGYWEDFEGREDLEIDEETYAELAVKQAENKALSLYSEMLDSTGQYGKAIIDHIKDGGNPDDIIDIFKEKKELESVDISTEQGQVAIISKYYNQVLGWKPERIQKHLQRIIQAEELEDESSDIVEKYNEHYAQELANIEAEREKQKTQMLERQREFSESIRTTLTKGDYTEKERKIIENSLLNIKKTSNGPTTEFNTKFAELQKNPEKLIKLVHFVMDEEGFQKKLNKKIETTQAAKQFSFIKGNAATKKSVGTTTQKSKNTDLDFSFLLK